MSRGNEPAFPVQEVVNGNGNICQHAAPGLTIHEFATLQLFAVAANMPGSGHITAERLIEASGSQALAFVAWLDRGGK